MEKVNKHNSTLTKGLRTKINYAKSQKDVEKIDKELVKLAKAAKPIKDAVKTAKDLPDAGKKWDDWSDAFIKSREPQPGRGQAQVGVQGDEGCLYGREEVVRRLPSGLPGGCGGVTPGAMLRLDLTCSSVEEDLALDERF